MNRTIFVLLLIFAFPVILFAQNKRPLITPQPGWVTTITVPYNSTQLDHEAEDGYVDLDYEKQTSVEQKAQYYKKVIRILTEAGVQNCSELSFDFDPEYEQLELHNITIKRGAETINKLSAPAIKVIQQEKELSRFVYNGALTAVIVLEDVRAGDVLEYSYTVRGSNPIFKNKFTTSYDLQFGVPIYQTYYKLITPNNRPLTFRNLNTDVKATQTQSGDATTYEWKLTNVPALHLQDNVPLWYDAYPSVLVSEYPSWKDVNDWAIELFPRNVALSAGLQKKINEIKAANQSTEDRILAALHFVQDDIRYMGFEMGANSHKPHAPSQVFAQRFGDCKDKSYLLCTMLKEMGVDANPVLINTTLKHVVANYLPSPTLFDHCTVVARAAGKTWWFDPTIAYQRGSLDEISYPDYKLALEITHGTTWFTQLPSQNFGSVHTREVLDIRDMTSPARLKVITTYKGSYADNVRYAFHSNSVYEQQKKYRNFYASYFPKIEADSLTFAEGAGGAYITTEYYTIKDVWKASKGVSSLPIEPFVINGFLVSPKDKNRSMPYSLSYPARYHEEVQVNLPEAWGIKESVDNVVSANLRYSSKVTWISSESVLISFDYESLKDHVAPEEASLYVKDLEKINSTLVYELSKDYNKTAGPESPSRSTTLETGYTSVYILLSIVALVTYIVRRNRNSY